jgi:hypothetical protein
MKKKIVGILICMLLFIPALSISAAADSEAELDIQIYGGFPIPYLIRSAGGVIVNIGDTTAYNITYNLSIIGGLSGNINITYEGDYDYLEPVSTSGKALSVMTSNTYGFGPVIINLTASATNAESVTVKAKGFQIGDFTWIPLSWIIPPILKGLFPWLDFE